ncbi:uncharacterized protein HMPREF1541_06563 [Cyphellophora europaea CBS 101466]|uniref:Uncharacterized protein n=1 Tax=Cyphellophora europaea (strain CBS 101466) TaxID=1220924 RepID=W2RS20_CYPE1|nr:uncharacterized protein HMPREF1541_06563 [Cyphellophora europaea CBS 101466]ETN38528.1 hypothetical protein HMPREF1541_06563 [Cyphellophora europaea CBS 101466]
MHLPITALETLLIRDRRIILAGQGPHLHLYNASTGQQLGTHQIFPVQPIHHITHQDFPDEPTIVVGGGRFIALLSLQDAGEGGVAVRVESRHQINAKEWILRLHPHDGCFLLLTANNVLFQLQSEVPSRELHTIGELARGPGSFLYSGDVASISSNQLLVAAGSVFGEVLVWTCQRISEDTSSEWITHTTHRFEGHTGSIFGVRISEELRWDGKQARFVASCSDDRTVQVWDVSDYDEPNLSVDGVTEVINTGFGQDAQEIRHRVATGWGHQSRIWDVNFLSDSDADDGKLTMMTRGEDGTCQLWTTSLPARDRTSETCARLSPISNDRHHSGKNIWAWTKYSEAATTIILSGGADGRVVKRQIERDAANACDRRLQAFKLPFKQLPLPAASQSLKDYIIVEGAGGDEVLALTAAGAIVRCRPGEDGTERWDVLADGSQRRLTKLCSNSPASTLIAAATNGVLIRIEGTKGAFVELPHMKPQAVAWIQVAGALENRQQGKLQLCIVITSMTGTVCVVWIQQELGDIQSKSQILNLPDHFAVTSSCYDFEADVLVLGSRAGAVATYPRLKHDVSESTQPICIRHVHGNDAVTSLQFIGDLSTDRGMYVLSTGRDGRYGIHCITTNSEERSVTFHTVHCSCPPFGPYVEGATVVSAGSEGQTNLVLHGFRSKEFVVWNETMQLDVFSVDCGGAHRSWAYRQNRSRRQAGGTFVWTKASTFNLHSEESLHRQVIQTGGHGREIKALATYPLQYSDPGRGILHASLIATGAEDTTIRIFAVNPEMDRSGCETQLTQLCTMNDHSAGLQDLVFSPCGTYLFSCGGAEQLYAWRLTTEVPAVGIGSVLQDKMPQTDEDSDVRIMSLSVRPDLAEEQTSGAEVRFRLAAAYSNGKIKVLRYSPGKLPGEGIWELERQVLLGAFCLMQIFDVPLSTVGSEVERKYLLSAGTNGFLNLANVETSSEGSAQAMAVHSVHQSSILAMDVVSMGVDISFIATGGDDNALGLTIMSTDSESTTAFATVRVCDAHAAALTALTIVPLLQHGGDWRVRVVTAGNDQKVKVWDVVVPPGTRGSASEIRVLKLREWWTGVADVSSIDTVKSAIVVTGVGIEVMDLKLDDP